MSGGVAVAGSLNIDLEVVVGHLPVPGETVMGGDLEQRLGGKGANQAVALARLGVPVRLIAAVGSDAGSFDVEGRLAAEGVGVADLVTVEAPTGRALIAVDAAGENSIVVSPGANRWLSDRHVAEALTGRSSGEWLVIQGEIPAETAAAAARAHDGPLLLNPAPVFDPMPPSLWDRTDIVVPNRAELAALHTEAEAADLDTVIDQVRRLELDRVVVTLGGDGCLVVGGTRIEHLPAPAVDVVDTTGAGDAFCAGLAAGLLEGLTLTDAAEQALWVGALTVTRSGAQTSPTRTEVENRRSSR